MLERNFLFSVAKTNCAGYCPVTINKSIFNTESKQMGRKNSVQILCLCH